MIQVRDVMTAARFQLGDMQGAERSDFELVEAINQAVSFIWGQIAIRQLNAGVKKSLLIIDEDELFTLLPSDFFRVRKVFDSKERELVYGRKHGYRISFQKFEAQPGTYLMEYFYTPARVLNETDILDVPNFARQVIEAVTAAFMKNDIQAADAAVVLFCREMAGQELAAHEDRGPVQVYGSRWLL